jgi:SAM-dependent methyltransferase
MPVQSRAIFERLYEKATSPADLPWHRPEPPAILAAALASRATPGTALDVGCGAGTYSLHLARKGFRVTGIDFMPQAVAMLAAGAAREGLPVVAVEADVLTWRPPAGAFDLVLDVGCLHSFSRAQHPLYKSQLLRWLAPGGDYVLVHCGSRGWWDRWPVGPTRAGKASLERIFAPELELRDSRPELLTGLPLAMGLRAEVGRYWFRRRG